MPLLLLFGFGFVWTAIAVSPSPTPTSQHSFEYQNGSIFVVDTTTQFALLQVSDETFTSALAWCDSSLSCAGFSFLATTATPEQATPTFFFSDSSTMVNVNSVVCHTWLKQIDMQETCYHCFLQDMFEPELLGLNVTNNELVLSVLVHGGVDLFFGELWNNTKLTTCTPSQTNVTQNGCSSIINQRWTWTDLLSESCLGHSSQVDAVNNLIQHTLQFTAVSSVQSESILGEATCTQLHQTFTVVVETPTDLNTTLFSPVFAVIGGILDTLVVGDVKYDAASASTFLSLVLAIAVPHKLDVPPSCLIAGSTCPSSSTTFSIIGSNGCSDTSSTPCVVVFDVTVPNNQCTQYRSNFTAGFSAACKSDQPNCTPLDLGLVVDLSELSVTCAAVVAQTTLTAQVGLLDDSPNPTVAFEEKTMFHTAQPATIRLTTATDLSSATFGRLDTLRMCFRDSPQAAASSSCANDESIGLKYDTLSAQYQPTSGFSLVGGPELTFGTTGTLNFSIDLGTATSLGVTFATVNDYAFARVETSLRDMEFVTFP